MESLTSTEWQQLLEVVRSLYEPYSIDEFAQRSLLALSKLAGAEIYGFHSCSFRHNVTPRHYTYPLVEVGMAAESFTAQPQGFYAHPVAVNYIKSLDGQALAISDFLSEQEFHRQDLYQGAFRNFDLEDHMVIHFEIPALCQTHPLYREQDFLSLSLGRDRRNFTERDRLILNIMAPHLKQAYHNAAVFTQFHQATEQLGLIILSIDGKVQYINQKAEKLLHQYFIPSKGQTALPELLQQWVKHQVTALRQPTKIPSSVRPLCLERDRKRLSIRFHYHEAIEQVHLLLEETQLDGFLLKDLEMLGLTKREAEVLFWIAKEESQKLIAKRLGISDHTVKKHLEKIYEKFDVKTRLAAVMYALKQLGIVNL